MFGVLLIIIVIDGLVFIVFCFLYVFWISCGLKEKVLKKNYWFYYIILLKLYEYILDIWL